MSFKDFTLEDMEIPAKDAPAPETPVQTEQVQEAPVPETPVIDTPDTPEVEVPAFDFKDKTGGAYEDFDSMWSDFQELKSKEPEVKEAAFKDDYIKKAVDYYNEHGDLTPFLKATQHNFDEMSDMDVIRHQMRNQYSDLSDKAFDKVFEKEIDKQFNPDEDEDLAKELMTLAANKARKELKSAQEEFKNSIQGQKDDEQAKVAASVEKQMQEWKDYVEADKDLKSVMEAKKLEYKLGDDTFTYELEDPSFIQEAAIDNNKLFSAFVKEVNGESKIDFAKFAKAMAYIQNPEKVEQELIKFGKSLGNNQILDDLENPTKIETPNRKETISGGGSWKDEFLAEVKQQFG